jgi:hypothetical protein
VGLIARKKSTKMDIRLSSKNGANAYEMVGQLSAVTCAVTSDNALFMVVVVVERSVIHLKNISSLLVS